jgi:hypothetical protein
LESDYDGHFSFANVQRMAIARIFVVKNNGDICVDKGVHLATALLSREYILLQCRTPTTYTRANDVSDYLPS